MRRFPAWCAGLLCAGASVVIGCRIANTDGITPVPQLLAFLPWLVAPVGLALACALLARWWAGLVWGVLVLGLLAWFLEPYGRTGGPSGPPVASLRVLTSNVEFGQGTEALVAAVRRERPDVVFVSECEHTCVRRLTEALDLPHRSAVPGSGSKGSLILSRFRLRGTAGVPGTMGMPGAVADVRGHAVRLQLAHPMPPLPGQVDVWREELAALRTYARASAAAPTILAGDFNASQDHASFRRILDTGLRDAARLTDHARTPTWPSRTTPTPGVQIDHVLLSRHFSARETRFLDLSDTDHRAVVADVTLHGSR
ncbi:endonuclease/exonuclease/phosphatase family protein [Streptomyces sp. NPDC003635]